MIFRIQGRCALIVLGLAATCASHAFADDQLPGKHVVRASIFNVPDVPASGLAWTVELRVNAKERRGNEVAWEVERIEVARYDAEGFQQPPWFLASPQLGTVDGLWRVLHTNPAHPVESDPWIIPPMRNRLTQLPQSGDLDTWIMGTAIGKPLLEFKFEGVNGSGPTDEGVAEPIDIDAWAF